MIPRDASLLRKVLDSRLLDVHTALPCRVEAFYPTTQTVDVQPMVKNVIANEASDFEESYPILYGIPVIYPRSGACMVAFPLEAGDFVTVVFHEWSLDHFIEKGTEVHPVDFQRHGFAGAVAFPGGPYPKAEPITETVDGLLLGYDGGALVKVETGAIALGTTSGTKQPVALADDVKAEIDALRSTVDSLVTAYNAHTHPYVDTPAGPSVTSPTTSGATNPAAVAEVGSSVVEVQE